MKGFVAAIVLVLLTSLSALAQTGPAWSPTGQAFLSVSTTTSTIKLPPTTGQLGGSVILDNSVNTFGICFVFGGSTVTAPATSTGNCGAGSYYLPGGQARAYDRNNQGYVAIIALTSSGTVGIQTGNGLFSSKGGGGIVVPPGSMLADSTNGFLLADSTNTSLLIGP